MPTKRDREREREEGASVLLCCPNKRGQGLRQLGSSWRNLWPRFLDSRVRNALVFDHFLCRPRRKKTIVCGELLNWTENPILAPLFPLFLFWRRGGLSLSFFVLQPSCLHSRGWSCILIAHWQCSVSDLKFRQRLLGDNQASTQFQSVHTPLKSRIHLEKNEK